MSIQDMPGLGGGEDAIRKALNAAEIVAPSGHGTEDMNLVLAEKERNDIGNADRFLARWGHDFLYVQDIGWHHWNGRYWARPGAEKEVKRAAHATARSVMEEVAALMRRGAPDDMPRGDWEDLLAAHMKWSVTSGNKNKLDPMVSEAAAYVTVLPGSLDADPLVLNLANGTMRLSGACDALTPHRRDDRLAKIADVEFDPEADCPDFLRFLYTVQPNPEIRNFLQVWTGYCLTGVTGEQKLVFNYGEGGNGKSVFIDLIAKMMGPYSASLPFASLLRDDRKRGGDATPDLARLPGVRLVRASEPEQGSKFAEATIKAITGGEEITARHLNKDFFDFVPEFKLTLSGNHKPAIRGQDRGIWRRFLLVPWEVNVPEADQDPDLPKKLWAERSGVLNWILDGLRIWLEQGLVVPDAVRAATDEYRADSDPLGRFIAECIEAAPGANVQASVMYDGYKVWCGANAERPWSLTAFGRAMPERGIEKSDGRIRVYRDVRLVNLPEGTGDPPPVKGPDDYG